MTVESVKAELMLISKDFLKMSEKDLERVSKVLAGTHAKLIKELSKKRLKKNVVSQSVLAKKRNQRLRKALAIASTAS